MLTAYNGGPMNKPEQTSTEFHNAVPLKGSELAGSPTHFWADCTTEVWRLDVRNLLELVTSYDSMFDDNDFMQFP